MSTESRATPNLDESKLSWETPRVVALDVLEIEGTITGLPVLTEAHLGLTDLLGILTAPS